MPECILIIDGIELLPPDATERAAWEAQWRMLQWLYIVAGKVPDDDE